MTAQGKENNGKKSLSGIFAAGRRTAVAMSAVAAIVLGVSFTPAVRNTSGASQPAAAGKSPFVFSEEVWDFGDIMEADGPVSHTFTFVNGGDEPLAIEHVAVSCGCTRPAYTPSPIKPGRNGVFQIEFNPEFRPGRFEKDIQITSGGGRYRNVLIVKGNVIPRPRSVKETYPFALGEGFRLDRLLSDMGVVAVGDPLSSAVGCANDSDRDIALRFDVSPSDGKLKVSAPDTLRAGERHDVTFTLSLPAKGGYGKHSYRVTPVVNGKAQLLAVTVKATGIDGVEYVPGDPAPQAKFSDLYHYFGKVKPGGRPSALFSLHNEGDRPLTVRWVEQKDGVICGLKAGDNIAPGGRKKFAVAFDTSKSDQRGRVAASLMIITNDPRTAVRNLNLEVDVFDD